MSKEIIRTNVLLSIEGEICPMMREIYDDGTKGNPVFVPTFNFTKDGSIFSRRDNVENQVEPERDWVDREVKNAVVYADSNIDKNTIYVYVIRIKNKPKELGIVFSEFPMEVEEAKIECISEDREV